MYRLNSLDLDLCTPETEEDALLSIGAAEESHGQKWYHRHRQYLKYLDPGPTSDTGMI